MKCELKIIFMNVQTDLFVLRIHFYYQVPSQRTLLDEEHFCSTQTIRREDCIVRKIMTVTVDRISNINQNVMHLIGVLEAQRLSHCPAAFEKVRGPLSSRKSSTRSRIIVKIRQMNANPWTLMKEQT